MIYKKINNQYNVLEKISKLLLVVSILFATVTTGSLATNVFNQLNQNTDKIASAAAVAGGSTLSGASTITIDKKYCTTTTGTCTESENINVTPGANVRVRLKYDNTGSFAATNAQVKDSLPAGFTYIPGSFQNCMTPSTTESVCDTITTAIKDNGFATMTATGISPTSGLYDLGIVGSGILEIGKYRYIQYQSDYINGATFGDVSCGLYVIPTSTWVDPGKCYNNVPMTSEIKMVADMIGKRYLQFQSDVTGGSYTDLTCNLYADNSSGFSEIGICPGRGSHGTVYKTDLLGNRFVQAQTDRISTGNLTELSCNLRADNSSGFTTIGNCPNRNQNVIQNKTDTLDATRGKGYIEYQIKAPTTTGTFGTEARITGAGTAGTNPVNFDATDAYTANVANSITVAAIVASSSSSIISSSQSSLSSSISSNNLPVSSVSSTSSSSIVAGGCGSYNPGAYGAGGYNGAACSSSSSNSSLSNPNRLQIKVNLTGAYDTTLGKMRTTLRSNSLIPSSQPYNTAPLNYNGSEAVQGGVLASTPSIVVDWVYVEIKNTTGTTVKQLAGWVDENGNVWDASTITQGIDLGGSFVTGQYNIIIRHRNHIAITNNTPILITQGSEATVDFTTNTNVKGGNQIPLATGKYGMRAADVNSDDSTDATDRNILNNSNEFDKVYDRRDVNLDAQIDATDRNISQNIAEAVANL